MKKNKVLLLVMLFVLLISGCGNTEERGQNNSVLNDDKIDVNRILEIDSGQYSLESPLKPQNMIYDTPIYTVDENVIAKKNLKLGNDEYVVEYKETVHYPVGDFCFYKYIVDGDEKKKVFIDNNGEIKSILYDYTFLDISKTESPEDVLEKLKIKLAKVVDVSYYSEVEIPDLSSDSNGFHSYYFKFYNKKNGYITEYLTAFVDDDGAVYGVNVRNMPSNDLHVEINKEKEHEAIELKMKSIFDTDTTKYLSYEMHFDPIIVSYENEYYVRYYVASKYLTDNDTIMSSFIFDILIPLDMINTPNIPTK